MSTPIYQNLDSLSSSDWEEVSTVPKSLLTRFSERGAISGEHEPLSSSESDYPRSTAGSGDEHSLPDIYKNVLSGNVKEQPAEAAKAAKDSSRAGFTQATGDRDEPVSSNQTPVSTGQKSSSTQNTAQDQPFSTAAENPTFDRILSGVLESRYPQPSQYVLPVYLLNASTADHGEHAYRQPNKSSNPSSSSLPAYESVTCVPESSGTCVERAKKLFRDAVDQGKAAHNQAKVADPNYPNLGRSAPDERCNTCSCSDEKITYPDDIEAQLASSATAPAHGDSNVRATEEFTLTGRQFCCCCILFMLFFVGLILLISMLDKNGKHTVSCTPLPTTTT
jgi:hypothetical protein